MRFDIGESVFNGSDLLGILIRDLDAETFFKSHDKLDGVQRIRAEVVDKGCGRRHFRLIHPQLFHDNLFDLLFSRRSHSKPPYFLASGPPSGSLRYTAFGGLLTSLRSPHAPFLSVGPTPRLSKLLIIGVRQKRFPAISRPPR